MVRNSRLRLFQAKLTHEANSVSKVEAILIQRIYSKQSKHSQLVFVLSDNTNTDANETENGLQ